ncbi:MAG: hypothetical protein WD029_03795 [Microthrixaceae bacterium]
MSENESAASESGSSNQDGSSDISDEGVPATSTEDAAQEIAQLRAENLLLHDEIDHFAEDASQKRSRRSRGILSVSLLVLGALLLPLATLTVWTRNQLLDTDRYVQTVAPLSEDPAVIDALTTRISTAIENELDIEALVRKQLPDNLQILAAPISAGTDGVVTTVTSKALKSKKFDSFWVTANKEAHAALVALLTGKQGKVVDTENGKIVISLGPLIAEVLKDVDKKFGLDLSAKIPAEKIDIKFTILDSPQLASLQSLVKLLNSLTWVLAVLAVGCFLGAIFVAPDRRKGVLRVGVGVVVSMALTLVALSLVRSAYLASLPKGVNIAAATAIFETLTRFVLQAFRTLFAIGVVLLLAAWIAGPSAAATWHRNLSNRI